VKDAFAVMNDFELLREYAGRASEDAFTQLVNRYVNMVYSAALRQAGDTHAAEEIAQVVFIILARKAAAIRRDTILSGWLLRTTRFVALNARRREWHRRQTEQEAMNLNPNSSETSAAWNQIAPLLDEALVCLSQKDRDAIALRFFENKSFVEIGRVLGVNEDSAQKRVSRAVDKLRANFAKRGTTLPGALVVGAIATEAVKAAPAHLSAVAASAAFSQAAAGGAISIMARTALAALDAARIRAWSMSGLGAAVAVVMLSLAVNQYASRPAAPISVVSSAPVAAKAVVPAQPSNPVQPPAAVARVDAAPTNSGRLLLRVLDSETAAPVPGVRLSQVWVNRWPNRLTNVVSTDEHGEAVLDLDVTPVLHWNIRVEVYKDGYVPKYVSWGESQGDKIDEIPAEFTTKLTPGVTIGGVVRNEKGEPIPDVQIVYTVMGSAPGASHARERLTMMGHYHTETTDSQGRWRCNHVPAQFRMIVFDTSHPDYMPGRFGVAASGMTNKGTIYLAESALLDQSAEMILRQGLVVGGTIVDESGNPVAGAKVTRDRDWRDPLDNQETGADGRFRFGNGSSAAMVVTVQAEGFAPRDMTIQPGAGSSGIPVALSKGAPLRVLVTSATGRPIADASIRFSVDEHNRERFAWRGKTDSDGILDWPSAPAGEQSYVVYASGYESQDALKWSPDGSQHLVRLHKSAGGETHSLPFRVSGTVVDADTRQAIDTFSVVSQNQFRRAGGIQPNGMVFAESVTTGTGGKFSCNLDDDIVGSVMEIRADGYLPVRLTNTMPPVAEAHFDVALKRGTGLAGTVQLPDGTLVARADVILQAEGGAYMRIPCELVANGSESTETDSAGRFVFQPRLGARKILVADKAGFAEVDVDQFMSSNVIVLQPWGRVAGTLNIGHRPGAGETVFLHSRIWRGSRPNEQPLGVTMDTKTDADGHFVFEGVIPGELEVDHMLSFRDGKGGPSPLSQRTLINVAPGKTTQVMVGGKGRRVIGSVTANSANIHIDWRRDVQSLKSKLPGEAAELTDEYWRSPAGREAERAEHVYVPVFETNGTFTINDVLPGDYMLNISISDQSESDDFLQNPVKLFNRKFIANLRKEITVTATDDLDSPLDLGVLQLIFENR
jgi:RNA polymerase sigma factor (sigma-70 family)